MNIEEVRTSLILIQQRADQQVGLLAEQRARQPLLHGESVELHARCIDTLNSISQEASDAATKIPNIEIVPRS